MRIIVIGAVAGGTSAAAKARRNDEGAEIIIYEKDTDISYSGCGLPYYVGGEVADIRELTPRDSKFFKEKYNIDVFIGHEVLKIHPERKELSVRNLKTNEVFTDRYDKLVIATGARAFIPNIQGVDSNNVFYLRNVQSARNIKKFIEERKPQNAVIAGTGFIGFEMLENLINLGINVCIIEKQQKITPNLDEDMAAYLEHSLNKKDIRVIKNNSIALIQEKMVVLEDGKVIQADMVIVATGIRPEILLAKQAGIEIGVTGAIKVNKKMQTSINDIYACGDCIETYSLINNQPVYRPLGTTANKTGRIAGDVLTGGNLEYRGNLGTSIFKLFDMTIASTGLTEEQALSYGYDIIISHNTKPDKPKYFNGRDMVIKAIADTSTEKILGVQIIGYDGVDKRIDIFAVLITYGVKIEEIFHLDLAYAPPFSTTKDPVHYTGMILENALKNNRRMITTNELQVYVNKGEKFQVIDTRNLEQYEKSHVDDAVNIPHSRLRAELEHLDKDALTITYCNKGVTGNAAQNILIHKGFKRVYNLSGGHKFYMATKRK